MRSTVGQAPRSSCSAFIAQDVDHIPITPIIVPDIHAAMSKSRRVLTIVVVTVVLLFAYVASFYHLRSFTHVTYVTGPLGQGRIPTNRVVFVSLADDKSLHRAFAVFYLPLVWWDATEIGPTFGRPLSKEYIRNYPAGPRFYLSGDELDEP